MARRDFGFRDRSHNHRITSVMHRSPACMRFKMEDPSSGLGDHYRYRTELMANPYSAPNLASMDRDCQQADSSTATIVGVAAVVVCVLACVASASAVWWAFQRVYNTVDSAYENTSIVAAVAMAFIVLVLCSYVRFVLRVRRHRLSMTSAVVAVLAASLALWSAFFIA